MSVLPPFALARPTSMEEALPMLSVDSMPLGGGTELLLAMRMRLVRPDTLVDLKRIDGMGEIGTDGAVLSIGGSVTHRQASGDAAVLASVPVLAETLRTVGNPRVRATGTLAGNLVFAEPKSDVIPMLLALDATVELISARGTRQLTIDELILGPYFSAREPDEILSRIKVPVGRVERGVYHKFQTMERPTVGVAALDMSTDRHFRRVVVGAVGERPLLTDHEVGERISGEAIAHMIEPVPDIAGSAEYKRHVTAVSIDRAVAMLDELADR